MIENRFLQRKKDILSKLDKSSIGKWDKKMINLCKKINSLDNYYTTSSCAGRIVIMIDSDKKSNGLFLWVSHDLIGFKELKEVLDDIKLHSQAHEENNKNQLNKNSRLMNFKLVPRIGQILKFKSEPCILHVACNNLEDAQNLLDKAKLAGWKKSGIIASGKRFVCELNSTERLEFPIFENKALPVNDDFLKLVVKKSNENLKKGWLKINKLKQIL